MSSRPITHLFTDIGGVLATNGWDRPLRKRTAERFRLDLDELNERHHLTYDTYEAGKMSLPLYLDRVIFYQPRSFTQQDVIDFIEGEGKAFPDMIQLVRDIRSRHGVKIAVVSNEGRELAADRIKRFRLHEFVDFFIVSSFVHFRKPDKDIFRLALDVAQAEPDQVVYIEDRHMFVEAASSMGLNAVWHRSVEQTRIALAERGLETT
jgi:putative hydrolase of the HAD superfamily